MRKLPEAEAYVLRCAANPVCECDTNGVEYPETTLERTKKYSKELEIQMKFGNIVAGYNSSCKNTHAVITASGRLALLCDRLSKSELDPTKI